MFRDMIIVFTVCYKIQCFITKHDQGVAVVRPVIHKLNPIFLIFFFISILIGLESFCYLIINKTQKEDFRVLKLTTWVVLWRLGSSFYFSPFFNFPTLNVLKLFHGFLFYHVWVDFLSLGLGIVFDTLMMMDWFFLVYFF